MSISVRTINFQAKDKPEVNVEIRLIPTRDKETVVASVEKSDAWVENVKNVGDGGEIQRFEFIEKFTVSAHQELNPIIIAEQIDTLDGREDFDRYDNGILVEFTPELDSITVTPATDSVQLPLSANETIQFSASILPSSLSQTVTWSLREAKTGVSINASTGLVTIAQTVTAGVVEVVAKSSLSETVEGTAEITIIAEV